MSEPHTGPSNRLSPPHVAILVLFVLLAIALGAGITTGVVGPDMFRKVPPGPHDPITVP